MSKLNGLLNLTIFLVNTALMIVGLVSVLTTPLTPKRLAYFFAILALWAVHAVLMSFNDTLKGVNRNE